MAGFVSYSGTPLILDALPAVKVRHYYGSAPSIYTYIKMYVHAGALALGCYCFEKQPKPETAIVFAISQNTKPPLVLRLTPQTTSLVLAGAGGNTGLQPEGAVLPAPPAQYFAGTDEQGWYWGAQLQIGQAALGKAGFTLGPGAQFKTATFYKAAGADGFGATCPVREDTPLHPGNFETFSIVPY